MATLTERSPLLSSISFGEEKKDDDSGTRTGSFVAGPATRNILDMLSFSSRRGDLERDNDLPIQVPEVPSFSILLEIIGARHLQFEGNNKNNNNGLMETYCVVQYGTKIVHRTLPYRGNTADQSSSRAKRIGHALTQGLLHKVASYIDDDDSELRAKKLALQNPIWTLQQDALWSIHVTPRDIANHKALVINLWARPLQTVGVVNGKPSSSKRNLGAQPILVGKVRLPVQDLVAQCNEERIESPLVDDFGREVLSTTPSNKNDKHDTDNRDDTKPLLAFRCRIASPADLELTQEWNASPTASNAPPSSSRIINHSLWSRAEVMQNIQPNQRAVLVTELPEDQVQGAFLSTAVAGTMGRLDGKVRIKPRPDPLRINNDSASNRRSWSSSSKRSSPSSSSHMYLTPKELKLETRKPSRNWVQGGGSSNREHSLGRIYVEILSCHDLPNVDPGQSLGNKTDAFCSLVYGDCMVQTDLIDDELSPHWMPWTQRAFVLDMSKDWPNPYGQALYLGVFGYKRKPLRRHHPLGRVEIHPLNFQRNTLYELEYNLYKDSHRTHREARGRIRIRLRIEMDNERDALLSSLTSTLNLKRPKLYINVKTKKSFACLKYTVADIPPDKFQLGILQGYIDEILQGYLRRLVYCFQDGGRSLIFWEPDNQLSITLPGGHVFLFPLFSLLSFIMGMLMVEHPQFIPGILCFAGSLFLLAQMGHRNRYPSPWKRCNSFGHYVRVLIGQPTTQQFERIHAHQGWDETQAQEKALRERMQRDQEFLEKREAVEKALEKLEQSTHMDTKSKDIIHFELLEVLGNIQGIIGKICRLLRFIDAIITWEESDLAFFMTLTLMLIGSIIMFLPWAFILQWTGRTLVVLLLGPQNRLIDVYIIQKHTDDEQRIRSLFKERIFEVRRFMEKTTKKKLFRQCVFGRYAVAIPSILWTPHRDYPLPTSTAKYEGEQMKRELPGKEKIAATAIGQQLFGDMIPRPQETLESNRECSIKQKENIEAILAMVKANQSSDDKPITSAASSPNKREREPSILLDAGFEVTDLFDEEAQFIRDVLKPSREDSNRELGVEIREDATASRQFLPAFKSIHEFPDVINEGDDTSSSSSDDNSSVELLSATGHSPEKRDRLKQTRRQSVVEPGVEISEVFEDEAAFAQQSWRGTSLTKFPPPVEEPPKQLTMNGLQDIVDEEASKLQPESIAPHTSQSQRIPGVSFQFRRSSVNELGVEITEEYQEEETFAKQIWRPSTHEFLVDVGMMDGVDPELLQECPSHEYTETEYKQIWRPSTHELSVDVASTGMADTADPELQQGCPSREFTELGHGTSESPTKQTTEANKVEKSADELSSVARTPTAGSNERPSPDQLLSETQRTDRQVSFKGPNVIRTSQSFSVEHNSALSPLAQRTIRTSVSMDEGIREASENSNTELGFEVIPEWFDDEET